MGLDYGESYVSLEMPAVDDAAHHQYEVDEVDGQQILPLQSQQLVDTQAGESPFEPYDYE